MVGKSKYLLAILCTMMPFFNAINAQDALTAVYWDATNESQCEDGVIDLHINGGFPPYDVHWTGSWGLDQGVYGITGNSGEEDLQNLRPGTYNVTVTDALCGTAQLSVQVGCSDCPELIAGIQHHGFIECEGKKGMLTVIVDDIGLPPYNIKWSNGDTTYTIFNEGIYSVEVTDSNDYEEMTIDVTSVLGQSMINKSFSQNSLQIETNQWNSGVYICVIRIDGEIIGTHKIIKQ